MELLASGYGLVEGPRDDGAGGVYWSDVLGGGVHRRSPDGSIVTVVPKRRGVGGILRHAEGGIVVSGRNLCHVRDGETRVLFADETVAGWNDLGCDAEGRLYAGSLRANAFQTGERTPGELWRIDAEGKGAPLYGDVSLANGIGFSPDGLRLYHSDTARNRIWVHDRADDGAWVNRRVFARLERGLPDGLAVDVEGAVWVAAFGGGCVVRLAPDGRLERLVEVPAKNVASVAFGGADGRDLYVATGDHAEDPALKGCLLRTRAPAPGLEVPPVRI